ncbi:MAG: hypothetical protein JXA54_15315 [Candidatus Heimdallarchaeota archaeon]|nr:hypothetical protein [Candidatus Heimdallarchaeota archaeon]
MNTNEFFYCPFCGSQQSKNQEFCGSCGANLKSTAQSPTMDSKFGQTTPPGQTEYSPLPGQQPYTYGAPAQTTYIASQQPKKDNANIALILGIVSFVVGGIITAIIGLVFAKKAEENNEDRQTIQIAKILCWIVIGFAIVGIIFVIIFAVMGGFSLYYW